MLEIKDIAIHYGNHKALENINFRIEKGDYLCIIGENGSGKSTLLKGILGLQPLKSGKIIYNNLSSNQIGYLPQQTVVQKDFPASVLEVVLSGCLNQCGFFPFYTKKEKDRALKNIHKLDIENLKNKSFRDLSGGQKQRVLLARALCASDKILFLDEPITGLDPKMTVEFYELIDKLNKKDGLTIVTTTHDINTAIKYANKILHLETEILFFGTTNAYIKSSASKLFLGGNH